MIEEAVEQFKSILPEGVEAVVISKNDYDRQLGDLVRENLKLKKEINKLTAKNIKTSAKYIRKINELNYVINETEKWLEKEILINYGYCKYIYESILNRIKELKAGDK